jgi:hypothetical protein
LNNAFDRVWLQTALVKGIAQSAQRHNLQCTCQSQQQLTCSSTSPLAAGPVLMAVSQIQSVDKL